MLTAALMAPALGCQDSRSFNHVVSPFTGDDGGGGHYAPVGGGGLDGGWSDQGSHKPKPDGGGERPDAGGNGDGDGDEPGLDGGSNTTPDGGMPRNPMHDASVAYDCFEEFVWDPGDRKDVQTVVIASGFLSNWNAALSPPLHLDSDGKWHARIGMFRMVMPYKFVINGDDWRPDPTACHTEGDGFVGYNSVRYACQEAPACPDAGTPEVDAGNDAGTSDAGQITVDGGTGDGDASTPNDASVGMDGATPVDAGEVDASHVDAGQAPDFSPGSHYLEVFAVDPKDYPHLTVASVELRGSAPFSWTEGKELHKDADGVFRLRVLMDAGDVEYKLRFNHTDDFWDVDRAYCATSNGNSLRSPGKAAPACCKNVKVAFAATGCASDATVALEGDLTGNWKARVSLTNDESGSYSITFPTLLPNTDYGYKIVINGSTYVPVNDDNCQDNNEGNSVLRCTAP